jgi:hypothetical protein
VIPSSDDKFMKLLQVYTVQKVFIAVSVQTPVKKHDPPKKVTGKNGKSSLRPVLVKFARPNKSRIVSDLEHGLGLVVCGGWVIWLFVKWIGLG